MLRTNDLFNLINTTQYIKTGLDVDYCIYKKDNVIYLFFQPSASKQDWITNFNFPVTVYKNQKSCLLAHKGFVKAYKSANDEIMEKLIEIIKLNPDCKISIVGWSLGGAMCQLAVEDLHYRTGIKADVITFGSPNVFFNKKSKDYVLACCNEVHQYADVNDIVTKVPFGYKQLNKVDVKTDDFRIYRLFNPKLYHCNYGNIEY